MSGTPAPEAPAREGIPLGRIAGIPIVLAYSWFVIAAFTVLVFGPQVAARFPQIGFGAYLVALAYAVLLLLSVLIHELAHALSARIYGWPTQKIVLNLWGGHTQFENFQASPGRSVIVALAGPAANFVLAAIGWGIVGITDPRTVADLLANIFTWANLLVAVFNVLPGLPLDGGRLVESAVWKATGSQEKGTVAAGWAGRIIVILLLVVSLGVPLLQGDAPNLQTVILTVMVCAFLWMGASAGIAGARMRLRLPAVSAGKLAVPALGMAASSSVAQLAAARRASPAAIVLCGPDGRPEALVDDGALAGVPDAAAAGTPATAVARALAPGAYVPEWSAGQELVQYLAQLAGKEYAVISASGQVVGLLHQGTVVAAITGKADPRPGL
ncbi:site-2 protease family protein [Paenarthrobacter sp. DKR-5]|uniref:site-2 protease family protein n=1 Tax=Paenarthrobacter sp. DKR-5 TaxID=2835535 RepID=UPI001BDCC1A4|nr:site-2 protease family protein [Paenarthrobacter sp. DKR-5]MBT1001781.1 site-2 protease family protein [Paenarthrobacter sp. DKR-5]